MTLPICVSYDAAESILMQEIPMRHFAFALIFVSPLLATTGCQPKSEENAAANEPAMQAASLYYTVTAGPVTGDRASGINGSFRFSEASGPDTGIESDLFGGACIIFRAEDLGYSKMAQKTCHSDEQCRTDKIGGYCQPGTNKCWARPPANPDPLCRRSLETHAPWPPDTDNKISESNPIPVPADLKANAQAVVVACLRGKGNGANSACGGPDSQVKWGQPTTIP
jgi:hypothetical protein